MYIPKNRIEINLYTSGGEFVYKGTSKSYEGFYHKMFNDKYFSGKTQNADIKYELSKILEQDGSFEKTKPYSKIAISDSPTILGDLDGKGYSEKMVIDYSNLKGVEYNNLPPKNLPYNTFPKPTLENYKDYQYFRYFVVKENESQFYEVSKETFDSISSKSKEWEWELFIPFLINWKLKGEEDEVIKVNKNNITFLERKIKKKGLHKFLNYDYSKYHLEG